MGASGVVIVVILTLLCLRKDNGAFGKNITELVFGERTSYLPAAFGDFNSDKLTDMFVLTADGKTLKILMSQTESPLFPKQTSGESPECTYKTLNIKSVVPGDYDGNGAMDVMIVSLRMEKHDVIYEVFILWGSLLNMTLECGSEDHPILKLSSQPLVMDVNGDMIPDLFGEDKNHSRNFWIFGTERKQPLPQPMTGSRTLPRLKLPSSHAFIDIDNDLSADLWVTSVGQFEIWATHSGVYQMNERINLPPNAKYIGQTSFADVNLDGNIEAIVPVCNDTKELCLSSSICIYSFEKKKWIYLDVSFEDSSGSLRSFATQSQSSLYTDTTTLRIGDFNLDGYPDILVTLFDSSKKPHVTLFENVKCSASTCNYPRSFAPKWDLFKDFGDTVLGTFFDFQEDGTLDVLLVQKTSEQDYQLSVYKDATDYDAVFVKELNISPDDSTPCIMFSRFFIPPPAQPNQYLDTGIKVDKILQHADHSTSHSIMFDCFLSAGERSKNECYPRASKSNSPAMPGGEVSHHGFSKGCWSPYGMSYEGGCLLALATYDHRLILFTQEGHKWEEVINLSTLWYKHVSSNSWKIVPVSKGASLHETYLARMQMLCLSELQWTPLFADCQEKFSVLIMITLSGHAVFWKVPSEVTSASEVQLLGTEETKMKFISSICWLTRENKSGYVVLGSSNGQAKIFYCTFSKELVMRDLGYVHANADRLRISHVMLLHISEKQHLLLLGKQSFLLAIALNLSENDLLLQSTIHTPLGRLPISGMICLKNNNLYLSMKDGNIQHVFLRVENGQVYAQHLGTHFHSEGVAYISLVKSPHSTLWAFLESVSVAYDHLVVREPTQISIYQVGSGAKIYDYLQEHPSPLHLCADILESLRLYSGKSGKCSLRFITPDKVDGLSEYHLKLCYWLVRMSRNIEESDSQNMESLRETERLLQKAILELWMNANISQISVSNVLDDSSLALSHFLMCDWIMNNGREKEKINAANVRRKFNKELQEQCPVCAEAVKMESLTSGTCPNGHTFPRCCRTFLMTKPMMMCPRCKSYTNKYARDLESGRVATCVYCDGRLKRLTGRRNE